MLCRLRTISVEHMHWSRRQVRIYVFGTVQLYKCVMLEKRISARIVQDPLEMVLGSLRNVRVRSFPNSLNAFYWTVGRLRCWSLVLFSSSCNVTICLSAAIRSIQCISTTHSSLCVPCKCTFELRIWSSSNLNTFLLNGLAIFRCDFI